MKKFSLPLSVLFISCGVCNAVAAEPIEAPTSRTSLFQRGDMGSTFWRIPAIATTNAGTVIAVADKRNDSNADLPNLIDVAMRRSTDGGATWSEPRIILKSDSGGGYGDPALGVHKPSGAIVMVAAHGAGLWDATAEHHQHVVVTRSTDDGLTWSAPVDITKALYDPAEGVAPVKALAGFASSGALHCDDNGRLMFVLVVHDNDEMWGPLTCYLAYSDDGGITWQLNPWKVDTFGDESKVAQLADGSYYMSIRNRNKGAGRHVSRSFDGGNTWSVPLPEMQLIDPACNGDLIVISPERMKEIDADCDYPQGLMLHSLANDPAERRNVTVLASDDLGITWRPIYNVTPTGSSYSALTLMPDGTLGIFLEENDPLGGFQLWFTKVDLANYVSF